VLAATTAPVVFADVARQAGDYFGTRKWYFAWERQRRHRRRRRLDLLVMDLNGHPHLLRNDAATP